MVRYLKNMILPVILGNDETRLLPGKQAINITQYRLINN